MMQGIHLGKKLPVPVILLAFAAVLGANAPQTTDAAPRPAPVATQASLPASTPTHALDIPAAGTAMPAVFARGADGLSPQVLAQALDAVSCRSRPRRLRRRDDLLTVIDYSLPSTKPRLWVLDLGRGKVLYHELVAHGAGSGDNYATHFSNVNGQPARRASACS